MADFRKDNGEAIRLVCREFVMLCRKLGLLNNTLVAIDGSKFKAVNNRDKNFTRAKMKRRLVSAKGGPTIPEEFFRSSVLWALGIAWPPPRRFQRVASS